MSSPKDNNYPTVIELQNMELGDLPDKEFKITVLRKLNELQESTERQFSEIRKRRHEQNEKFNKQIEIIKKRTKQILELNNSINKMKSAI